MFSSNSRSVVEAIACELLKQRTRAVLIYYLKFCSIHLKDVKSAYVTFASSQLKNTVFASIDVEKNYLQAVYHQIIMTYKSQYLHVCT